MVLVLVLVLVMASTHLTSMLLSLSHQMATRMLRHAQRLPRPLRLMAQQGAVPMLETVEEQVLELALALARVMGLMSMSLSPVTAMMV